MLPLDRLSQQHLLVLDFMSVEPKSAPDIQKRFGWSQPTVSRVLSQCAGHLVAIGNARSRRYARVRGVRGIGGEFPVYKVDTDGNAHNVGTLVAITQEGYLWRPTDALPAELFRGLPWFIADLRPEGFVGRAFVRELHQDLALPPRGTDWNDDQVLLALARRGQDCMGNLIVGQESLERYFQMVRTPVVQLRPENVYEAYPRMAQTAMDGQPVGSSAGGEQPKFTTVIQLDNNYSNVLVKFSQSVSTPVGRRWADLLICEHHALEVVRESGILAAQTRIIEAGGQVFLEVVRFDRVGRFGRLPIISLRAVDNEFYGYQDTWVAAATRLQGDNRLEPGDASSLRWLSVFGDLIGNTDQHFGNVSLIMVDGRRLFTLAPAYDILPMLYRPRESEVTYPVFTPPPAAPNAAGEWDSALDWACIFWGRAAQDQRISEEFRGICAANLQAVRALQSGPRLVN